MKRNSKSRTIVTAFLFAGPFALSSAARAEGPQCGPHEHVVVEKDEDEGSTVKRCVCDEGWDATGPAPPCHQKDGAKDAPKDTKKSKPKK